jgi:VWFA-related protein
MRSISEGSIVRRIMPVNGSCRWVWAVRLFCACFLGMTSYPANQSMSGAEQAAQSAGSFNMRVDVDLVTVEVSALDKNGKAVRNLKKEDFTLYEDGKKQAILSFDEVDGQTATSPKQMPLMDQAGQHRGKTVMILFVDSSISPRYVRASRDSAYKYVREHMQPQDLFAVGSYVSSMQILQNFTSDPEEVLTAIQRSVGAYGTGMLYFDDMLRSLEQINYAIARLKGPKSILLYAHIGLGSSPTIQTPYANALNSAKRSNVIYYTIDPNVEFSGSNPAPYFRPSIMGSNTSSSGGIVPVTLMSLARESGGFSIYDTTNLNEELDRLDVQISNYYILGFQTNNPKRDGTFRKIEVKTNLKGLTLKHRAGYQDRSPIDVLASSRQEQALMAALATPGSSTQLPIVFRSMYFYDSPHAARVIVAARVRMDKAVFRKKGSQMGTDLNLMGVAYAEDGSIAARFSETLPVSFDTEKETEFRKGHLAYHNYFKVRPGKYRLRLAVSDNANNLGSIEQSVEVPPFPVQGITGSSLVLVEQTSALPHLIQNLQNQMLDQSDPLIHSGLQVEPGVENRLPLNSAVRVLFRLYNLPGRPDEWNLVAKPKLVSEKGAEWALPPISLKKSIAPAGTGEAVVGLSLPFQGVVAGKYGLVIEIVESNSTITATLRTDLEFTN